MTRSIALLSCLASCAPYFRADEERARNAMDARALQDLLDDAAEASSRGDHARSIDAYVQAIERNPRLPGKVYFRLANELLSAGQSTRSLAVAQFALGRGAEEPEDLAATDRDVEALAGRFDAAHRADLATELRASIRRESESER